MILTNSDAEIGREKLNVNKKKLLGRAGRVRYARLPWQICTWAGKVTPKKQLLGPLGGIRYASDLDKLARGNAGREK